MSSTSHKIADPSVRKGITFSARDGVGFTSGRSKGTGQTPHSVFGVLAPDTVQAFLCESVRKRLYGSTALDTKALNEWLERVGFETEKYTFPFADNGKTFFVQCRVVTGISKIGVVVPILETVTEPVVEPVTEPVVEPVIETAPAPTKSELLATMQQWPAQLPQLHTLQPELLGILMNVNSFSTRSKLADVQAHVDTWTERFAFFENVEREEREQVEREEREAEVERLLAEQERLETLSASQKERGVSSCVVSVTVGRHTLFTQLPKQCARGPIALLAGLIVERLLVPGDACTAQTKQDATTVQAAIAKRDGVRVTPTDTSITGVSRDLAVNVSDSE